MCTVLYPGYLCQRSQRMVLRNTLLENKIELGVMVFVKERIIDQREKKTQSIHKNQPKAYTYSFSHSILSIATM